MNFRKLKFYLLFYLLFELVGGLAYGQNPYQAAISQSLTVSTVAPPANTPLVSSSLFCSGTAGTFASGSFLVAYTYTGTAAASESKASSDASATVLVTCPTNGTLTIPSPPSPPGCFNCVGWRPYVIASASGTNAELLQTITSANCTLAATSGLTACAIGSTFTETALGAGAAEPTNPTLFTPTPGAFLPLSETGLGMNTHMLSWVITGTAATCTIAIQTSPDNVTYTTQGAVQTCTASGAFQINATAANFTRLNLTAYSATGANVPSLTATLVELPSTLPSTTWVTCGSATTCALTTGLFNTSVKVVFGSCTLAANTCTITAMPAFASTSSFVCTANDITAANPVRTQIVSTTSITLTNTTGATDQVQYTCMGT